MTGPENEITADLIAELLRDQHPDLADLPLTFGARGWDNQLWRLGDDLAVRLPCFTQDAGELLLKEHALLPAIAPRLPLPIPVPQRLGLPSERFPRSWIVTTWVAGEPADRAPATRGAEAADALAAFLAALHQPAPDDVPAGRDRRGRPLRDISAGVARFLKEATDRVLVSDPDAVREVWDDALAAPDWTGPALWLHGDLHPANLLTRDGNFCGVVDFGDMCAGDPACDLAACWMVLPDGVIDRLQQSYSPAVDAATLRRARGWALCKALVCLLIGDAGVHGRPGGKATWGPPGDAALQRLVATRPLAPRNGHAVDLRCVRGVTGDGAAARRAAAAWPGTAASARAALARTAAPRWRFGGWPADRGQRRFPDTRQFSFQRLTSQPPPSRIRLRRDGPHREISSKPPHDIGLSRAFRVLGRPVAHILSGGILVRTVACPVPQGSLSGRAEHPPEQASRASLSQWW